MEKKRELWIDVMRGISIISVVICHQQHILHESETVQCIFLFCVTAFIFLMGVTKAKSLKSYYEKTQKSNMFSYTVRSMTKVLLGYVVVTIVCEKTLNRQSDIIEIWHDLISFRAMDPFYFLQHYVRLSIYAPLLYLVISKIKKVSGSWKRRILFALFLLICWCVCYLSIHYMDIFSQSYLFVYAVGMVVGECGLPKPSIPLWVFAIGFLGFGTYAEQRFYFARVAGERNYAQFIDVIDPQLQLSPPNLSVIIYSLAVVLVVYLLVETVGDKIPHVMQGLSMLGKYSMDIFLWHMWIQRLLFMYVYGFIGNIWINAVVFYMVMLLGPVIGRIIWEKIKAEMHQSAK